MHAQRGRASMKAVVYEGPRQVSVKEVPDARIERPTDVLVRITSANICGSDLHMYEGRTDFEPGRWFGHENLGQVVEVGDRVDKVNGGYVGLEHLPRSVEAGSAHASTGRGGAPRLRDARKRRLRWVGVRVSRGGGGGAGLFTGCGPRGGGSPRRARRSSLHRH